MGKELNFTEGSILKQVILFSGPIILANLLQASYQFVDSLWVGNLLGAKALGSVAVSAAVIFTVLSFILGLNNAALTILSQQRGRHDSDGFKRYLNAFVVTLFFLSLLLGVLGILLAPLLLKVLGTPIELMPDAIVYLRINFCGILFITGYNFISTVLRALGDSKSPLRFVFLAVVLNTVLDPLFIKVFNLGVSGAGYATVISQAIAFIYGFIYIYRRKLAPFSIPKKPAKKEVLLILKLGIPAGLQMAVISGGVAAVMSVVASFGSHVVAGFGAAQRMNDLLMIPAQSLGVAASSMAGQNIGSHNWNRVKDVAKYTVIYNFICMVVIGVLLLFFAEYGVRLFIQDEAAVKFGRSYLQAVGLFYPFLGINFVLNGVVRAAGAMYQVLILNIISMWILRYPLAYLFSNWFGEAGIAYGMGVSFLISALCAYLYYHFGKWREKELFTSK